MIPGQNKNRESRRNPRERAAGRSAASYARLGEELLQRGQASDAALAFEHAVHLHPECAEARNSWSVALRLQGRLDEAVQRCREAARLAPHMPEVHNNLGSMLQEKGDIDDAIHSLQEALRLRPDFANAHSNLGIAFYRQHRYAEAVANYRRAIELQPDLAEAHNNLGSVLFDLGRSDESLASFTEAIRLKPDYREAHWGRALVWLSRGEFERGWPEFEWRLPSSTAPRFHQPRWDGASLAGRTILLETEQGFGDTLQFVRYAARCQREGGKVVLVCQPQLVPLLAGGCPGIDQIVAQGGDLPPFDVHLPLMSLPGILRTTLPTIPADVPYVHPDPGLVAAWRTELSRMPGIKIGIAWQGRPQNQGDRQRSIPLAEFEPLAQVPGVQLINLQKGAGREQLGPLTAHFPVVDFADRLDEASGPFMDTAAIMRSLDLVICCDSAVAHLAGAMGVPVWLAIPMAPDWRWLLDRDDSPWYPSLRLFRQKRAGCWTDVFQQLVAELRRSQPANG